MFTVRRTLPLRPLICVICLLAILVLSACAATPATPAVNPQAAEHLALAQQQGAAGNSAAAIEQYGLAIDADPALADAWLGRATAYLATGSVAEARSDLDHLLTLDPANREALMTRAGLLESVSANEAALADLDALLTLDPNNPDAHILRGSILTALARPEAAADFQAALRLRPNAATVLAMQAIAYAQSGKYAAAQSDLNRALQLGLSDDQANQVRKVIEDAAPRPEK